MGSGILYELDMRLRPSGNSGLLVVHIDTYAKYQQEEAWTWEHQALVRAKMIFGNASINKDFVSLRNKVLTRKREDDQLKQDVLSMREKMRNHLDKSTDLLFDIKQGVGGLVDIEFLAQYLVLANSAVNESLLKPGNNIAIFKELNNIDVLLETEKKVLIESYERLLSLGHKATLQNDALLIEPSFFTQRENILKIWNKYFQV